MIFDKRIDFPAQLQNALAKADATGKKVIVEFGGDWCYWSMKMHKVLTLPKFKALIDEHFILLRCNVDREDGSSYPKDLPLPHFTGVPFFIMLNEKAEVLARQETSNFEFFRFYKRYKIYAFLKEWSRRTYF